MNWCFNCLPWIIVRWWHSCAWMTSSRFLLTSLQFLPVGTVIAEGVSLSMKCPIPILTKKCVSHSRKRTLRLNFLSSGYVTFGYREPWGGTRRMATLQPVMNVWPTNHLAHSSNLHPSLDAMSHGLIVLGRSDTHARPPPLTLGPTATLHQPPFSLSIVSPPLSGRRRRSFHCFWVLWP